MRMLSFNDAPCDCNNELFKQSTLLGHLVRLHRAAGDNDSGPSRDRVKATVDWDRVRAEDREDAPLNKNETQLGLHALI